MMETPNHDITIPALLRAAGLTYRRAIGAAFAAAGFDDLPRDGLQVLGTIARNSAPLSRIIEDLGVSKQVASQLVDALVLRGYLDRQPDDEDRRRLTIALTERGKAAAIVARTVVNRIETDLLDRVGADRLAEMRKTLTVLASPGREGSVTPHSREDHPMPVKNPLDIVEIKAFVPAKDFAVSQQFYQDIGFTKASEGGGIAYFNHGRASFLLQDFCAESFAENFMIHILVTDVEAWWDRVNESGVVAKYGVTLSAIELQPWRMRDFCLTDPSGVLWRIGQNVTYNFKGP